MRIRIFQRWDEEPGWFDDAYAFEDGEGRVVFRYNLTWEQIGGRCSRRIREGGISLEEIETVIPSGDGARWLPIEVVAEEMAAAYLETLNEACGIPKPRSIRRNLYSD